MIVQDFLAYRKKFRVGMTPISSEEAPKIIGWPQNLQHDSDVYQALAVAQEQENCDGYVFSTIGERFADEVAPSHGHAHELEKTFLEWWPIGSWQAPADRGDVPEAFTIQTDAAFDSKFAVILGTLQEGCSSVVLRACASGPSGAGTAAAFQVKATFYGSNDTTFASPLATQVGWDLSVTHSFAWRESSPLDVSSLDIGADRELIVVLEWAFDVSSGSPAMVVYQVHLGGVR